MNIFGRSLKKVLQLLMLITSAGKQFRCVPLAEYRKHLHRLAQAEIPRRFFHRFHRDPAGTIQKLVDRYSQRRFELAHPIHASRDA